MAEGVFARRKPSRNSKESEGRGKNAGSKARVRVMEGSKRLVPYSVYLDASVHEALKEKARSRGASKMVRDAITMIIEGNDAFSSGYKQGLRDAMDMIHRDELAATVSVHDRKIADHLIDQLEGMLND